MIAPLPTSFGLSLFSIGIAAGEAAGSGGFSLESLTALIVAASGLLTAVAALRQNRTDRTRTRRLNKRERAELARLRRERREEDENA